MRDASPAQLEKFWASQIEADISPEHRWECLGPTNVAGRVTALAIHPNNPTKWFAGSATGGVWVSTDSGATWIPTWSRFANQNISALTWYSFDGVLRLMAATGEANMSSDSYPGSGLYVSADEGLTWQKAYGPPFGQRSTIDDDVRAFPRRVGSMVFRGTRAAVGSIFLDDTLPAGLYLDNGDGAGLTACEFWGQRSYNCHSVIVHPHDDLLVYAAIEPDGYLNGIWRSRDFGKSWQHLTRGLPSGDQFRRITLAFAPSDPNIMYALAANRRDHILGLFRSRDGGGSWREILGARYPRERQMSYNNAIAIHPHNPDSVVWGGMKLYRTDDAGRSWRAITSSARGSKDYVHSDNHALLWPEDEIIVSGNDGGVAVTHNGGRTWSERSSGMVTAMFYGLGVAPSDGNIFGGGTQDNGTVIGGLKECKAGEVVPAIPGDGAWLVFDPTHAGNVLACATEFQVYRHRNGKPWDFDHWSLVKPRQISNEEAELRTFTVMTIGKSHDGGVTILAGTSRLWQTGNAGKTWKPISPTFDGTAISAIEIANGRPRLIFVGTTGGGIFRTGDGGATWSQSLSCVDIPARPITSIQTHPKIANTVVVTVASSGNQSSGVQLQTGADLPYSHVFRSQDRGNTWTDIDAGKLPNVVYYASAYQTEAPYQLFIGGDVGVWAEIDGGWLNMSGNLPCVVVSDLVYHRKDRTLTAATYGRGIWRIRPGIVRAPPTSGAPPEQIAIATGLRVDPSVAAPVVISPADGAVIDDPSLKTVVTVQPVANAMGYQVEFASPGLGSQGESSTTPVIQFLPPDFRGGKWRVWAILPDGLRSAASAWRAISYAH
jgi:photosystem II stability/assembly factor-like uncharacterized protein